MPRSIQQLKHRTILFDVIPPERLASAVQILERLPGVSAFANLEMMSIAVDYWVDEYMLSELEMELAKHDFPMARSICSRILRTEIQYHEDIERDAMDSRPTLCRSGGVFANTYRPWHDDVEALINNT